MQQIADWLEKLGLSEYTARFAENGIDISVLRLRLYTPLRVKITSSAQSLVPLPRSAQPRIELINPNRTAR